MTTKKRLELIKNLIDIMDYGKFEKQFKFDSKLLTESYQPYSLLSEAMEKANIVWNTLYKSYMEYNLGREFYSGKNITSACHIIAEIVKFKKIKYT